MLPAYAFLCVFHLARLPPVCRTRTARRFKKQIFLSVDIAPSFMSLGDGPRLLLAVEKAVVDHLKSLEVP